MIFIGNVISVVEISFDKVISHFFSDSMRLVTLHSLYQEEKFYKLNLFRSLEIARYLRAWKTFHSICYLWRFLFLGSFKVFFFVPIGSTVEALLYHAINLDMLDCARCFAEKKLNNWSGLLKPFSERIYSEIPSPTFF